MLTTSDGSERMLLQGGSCFQLLPKRDSSLRRLEASPFGRQGLLFGTEEVLPQIGPRCWPLTQLRLLASSAHEDGDLVQGRLGRLSSYFYKRQAIQSQNLKCRGSEWIPDSAIHSSPQAKQELILNKPPWPSLGKGWVLEAMEPAKLHARPTQSLLLRTFQGRDAGLGFGMPAIPPRNSLFRLRLGNPPPHRSPPSQKLLPSSLLVVFIKNSSLDSYNRWAEKRFC